MLKFRLIARMDIRNDKLIKTVRLEGVRPVGDPAVFAKRYNDEGIEEILYLDVVASLYGRNGLHDLLDRTTADVFTPVTAGGGIRSVEDALSLLRAGADKIALNTAAIKRPELITELAEKIGSQSVVVHIDAKRKGNGWEAYCDGGREPTGRDAVSWSAEAIQHGAGELLVTSIDMEGAGRGYDLHLAGQFRETHVPVVIGGGFATPDDALAVARSGASGCAIAGALHYNRVSISDIKQALKAADIPVRMAA